LGALLASVAHAACEAPTSRALIDAVVRELVAGGEFGWASYLEWDPPQRRLARVATRAASSVDLQPEAEELWLPGAGVAGRAFAERRTLVLPCTETSPLVRLRAAARVDLRACLATPILHGERVEGVLEAYVLDADAVMLSSFARVAHALTTGLSLQRSALSQRPDESQFAWARSAKATVPAGVRPGGRNFELGIAAATLAGSAREYEQLASALSTGCAGTLAVVIRALSRATSVDDPSGRALAVVAELDAATDAIVAAAAEAVSVARASAARLRLTSQVAQLVGGAASRSAVPCSTDHASVRASATADSPSRELIEEFRGLVAPLEAAAVRLREQVEALRTETSRTSKVVASLAVAPSPTVAQAILAHSAEIAAFGAALEGAARRLAEHEPARERALHMLASSAAVLDAGLSLPDVRV
jgi:hypothetical protein